jgi:hypothetical protein
LNSSNSKSEEEKDISRNYMGVKSMEIINPKPKNRIYNYEEEKVEYQKDSDSAIYIADKKVDNGHERLRAMFNRPAMKEHPVS